MRKQPLPDKSDPVYQEVMRALRKGKNPDHDRLTKLDAKKQKAVRDALKKRKGKHRPGSGGDDVIDTGMFGS